jgi:thioredoxin-related protein
MNIKSALRWRAPLVALAFLWLVPIFASTADAALLKPSGLHHQPWIKEYKQFSLKDILAEAKAEGKEVVILFEQIGCAFCARLHAENFSYENVVNYMNKHFNIIQIDLRGNRQVTLLNGKTLTERAYSRSLGVTNTPTTLFMQNNGKERFRMPGYIEAAPYRAGFQYVVEGGPESGVGFFPWLRAFIKRSREKQSQ